MICFKMIVGEGEDGSSSYGLHKQRWTVRQQATTSDFPVANIDYGITYTDKRHNEMKKSFKVQMQIKALFSKDSMLDFMPQV